MNKVKEFEQFMAFVKSFKDKDFFAFHFDYGDSVQNVSIYRSGNKLKYASDYRFKEAGNWFLSEEEEGVFTTSVMHWLETIFDASYMHQGWCNVDCDYEL